MPIEVEQTHAKLKSAGACMGPLRRVCEFNSSSTLWNNATTDDLIWLLSQKSFCDAVGAARIKAVTRAIADALVPFWAGWCNSNLVTAKGYASEVLSLLDDGQIFAAQAKADLGISEVKLTEPSTRHAVVQAMKAIKATTSDRPTRGVTIAIAAGVRSGAIADLPGLIRGVLTYAEVEAAVQAL